MREGPLRLGLRGIGAAADEAADPPRGRPTRRVRSPPTCAARGRRVAAPAQARRLVDYDEVMPAFREATWDEALDLSRGACTAIYDEHGPRLDRGLRLGQVLERGGLPLPEADPRRLRHQQRRSLHPAVPRVVRRGAARRDRLRRGVRRLRRRRATPTSDPRRHEHDRQPPGRGHVLQAGGEARHQAHRRRPAAAGTSPTSPTSTASSSPGTDVAFYNAVMHVIIGRGLVDEDVHPRPDRELRGAEGDGRASTRRSASRRSAASPPRRSASVARAMGAAEEPDHLLGHGHQPAHARAPTTPAA